MEVQNTQHLTTDYNNNVAEKSSIPYLSAVSWGAIFAGATAAAALSLIFLILGVGFGLSSVSPWSDLGISGAAFGVSTILWITITSVIASAIGGYVAGRLRTRWISTSADEVHFRDTAHGFLTWGVATLLTASVLTSAISAVVGGAAKTGATLAGAGAATAAMSAANDNIKMGGDSDSFNYLIDTLLRPSQGAASPANANNIPANHSSMDSPPSTTGEDNGSGAGAVSGTTEGDMNSNGSNVNMNMHQNMRSNSAAPRVEVARIFVNGIDTNGLSPEDVRYAGQIVAQHTGLSQPQAEKRVEEMFSTLQTKLKEAKIAADKARKASAYSALWIFIALLMGAFVASLAAVYGGRQRDFN